MTPRRPGVKQGGQSIVLFALMLPVFLGMLAVVADLGYGMVERRDLQNAADLGSLGASDYINSTASPSDAKVVKIINDMVSGNASMSGVTWTAQYWSSQTNASVGTVGSGSIPSNANGVRITPTVTSHTYFAGILGVSFLNVSAAGGAEGAINPNSGGSPLGGTTAPGIVSLDAGKHIWPHSIISDASGTFDITNGSIIADDCYGNWNGSGTSCSDNGTYTDVVDAKSGSTMNISGQFITASGSPFDGHFSSGAGYVGGNKAVGDYGGGNETTITYGGGLSTGNAYYPDPLRWLTEPTSSDTACPGSSAQGFTAASYGTVTLAPGTYSSGTTKPVMFTGSVTLNDCGSSVPGIYIFPTGAIFEGNVTGSNVMLYSSGTYANTEKLVCTDSKNPQNGGAQTNEPGIGSTSGLTDFGFIFTGHTGSVTLSAPNEGLYRNVVLFQQREAPALMGFRVCPGDSGNINLTGTVYAHNIKDVPNGSNTMSVKNTSWSPAGDGSGLVFGTDDNYQDGMGNTKPTYGGGNLYIDGCAVVDIFYTTGNANTTIQYDLNHVPMFGSKIIN